MYYVRILDKKTLNCNALSRISAGIPELGKSMALIGVSLEINMNSWTCQLMSFGTRGFKSHSRRHNRGC
jgi:hypothetical protein